MSETNLFNVVGNLLLILESIIRAEKFVILVKITTVDCVIFKK